MLKSLIARGVRIDAVDDDGHTATYRAERNKHPECVSALKKAARQPAATAGKWVRGRDGLKKAGNYRTYMEKREERLGLSRREIGRCLEVIKHIFLYPSPDSSWGLHRSTSSPAELLRSVQNTVTIPWQAR